MLRHRPSEVPTTSPADQPVGKSLDAATTTAMDNPRAHLLGRTPPPSYNTLDSSPSAPEPTNPQASQAEGIEMDLSSLSRKSQWIILAIASGACAAFNGVFAKLTTTELTTSFASAIARMLGLGDGSKAVEVVIRGMFFGLNLIFNGVMWALFTKALARGTSTVQVSIINTSSNFIITAVLGFFIFTESLPPLWWVGASLLVAGNVIIGRREEKEIDPHPNSQLNAHGAAENGESAYSEEEDGLLCENMELNDELETALKRTVTVEEGDILDLEPPSEAEQR